MNIALTPHLRIIWAIMAKDLIDAVKNKKVLGVIIPALFVIVLYRFLPVLNAEDGPPALLVYDEGNSSVVSLLEESPAVDLTLYENKDQMLYYLSNGEMPELGLVIPSGIDQTVESGSSLVLEGYMLHFFSDNEISELQQYIEDELEYLLGQNVTIQVNQLQLQPETHGITVLASLGFGFVILMVGIISIPHMMLEEKQNKTLDVMLVSPARNMHIIVAKSMIGLVFSMIVFGVGLFLFRAEVVHWGLALLSGLLGGLFAVFLGLMLGIIVDNQQQLILWAWIGLIPLFLPMMLSIMDDLIPSNVYQIVKWVPSSALMRALRSSMVGDPPMTYYLPQLIILLLSTAIILVIDIWLVRRMDR